MNVAEKKELVEGLKTLRMLFTDEKRWRKGNYSAWSDMNQSIYCFCVAGGIDTVTGIRVSECDDSDAVESKHVLVDTHDRMDAFIAGAVATLFPATTSDNLTHEGNIIVFNDDATRPWASSASSPEAWARARSLFRAWAMPRALSLPAMVRAGA